MTTVPILIARFLNFVIAPYFCVAPNVNVMMGWGDKLYYCWGSRSHHTIDWDTVVDICVWWSISKPFHLGRWEAIYCRLLARTVGFGERKRGKLNTVMSPRRHGVSNHHNINCLLNSLFKLTTTKTSQLYIPGTYIPPVDEKSTP